MPRRICITLSLGLLAVACQRATTTEHDAGAPAAASASAAPEPPPKILYLPDAYLRATDLPELEPAGAPTATRSRCPSEMVDVGGRFCIDRFEISLADKRTSQALSPYYHPTSAQTRASYQQFRGGGFASTVLRPAPEFPLPPPFQLSGPIEPLAEVKVGVHPSGYLNQILAGQACRNAEKRLCTSEEWVLACRGEADRQFPYGNSYEAGRCNVFRDAHPAALLHGDASAHHLDPRLNLVAYHGDPLLHRTGGSSCRSSWGSDAVEDMVGNLDEWTADATGMFRGGFYARATKAGCEAAISSHPPEYFDYSLGTRCCR